MAIFYQKETIFIFRKLTFCCVLCLIFMCSFEVFAQDTDWRGKYKDTPLETVIKMAGQGDEEAQEVLGIYYLDGNGVPEDYKTAFSWLYKAAEKGRPNAQSALGFMYMQGLGVDLNEQEAVSWWMKAANQGDVNSQNNLGFAYYRGRGVQTNLDQAVFWWKKSADKGNMVGQRQMGIMYEAGAGVARNVKEAWRSFRDAAYQGDSLAQLRLGVMYEYAIGVNLDPIIAYAIYEYVRDATKDEEIKGKSVMYMKMLGRHLSKGEFYAASELNKKMSGVDGFSKTLDKYLLSFSEKTILNK